MSRTRRVSTRVGGGCAGTLMTQAGVTLLPRLWQGLIHENVDRLVVTQSQSLAKYPHELRHCHFVGHQELMLVQVHEGRIGCSLYHHGHPVGVLQQDLPGLALSLF